MCRDGHPDPRRVFREAWRLARGHGEYGAWLAADWLHSNVHARRTPLRCAPCAALALPQLAALLPPLQLLRPCSCHKRWCETFKTQYLQS